ncbi:MAG: hypothetical protein JXO44_02755 [Clostridia bacterium]|nr:hypothetical protein [Clostridia bacterium]
MKKLLSILVLLLWIATSSSFCETQGDYTLMIYMNGSTLESNYDYIEQAFRGNASKDLSEMIAGYQGDDHINIILETIGTKRWDNDYVSSEETQRFILTQDGFKLLASLPNQNVGYKKGLSDFILWSKRLYPSDHYGLILWNHGGGPVYGFGLDENFGGDILHIEELVGALSTVQTNANIHFDFIGFDACLMASLEIADALSPYADYLFASEEWEPSHGWYYTTLLEKLHETPTMDTETLGKIIADSYLEEANEKGESYNITFSVIKLAAVQSVVDELELLTEFAQPFFKTPANFYDFAKAAAKSRAFGGNTESLGYTDLIDLKDFADQLSKKLALPTERITEALDAAVVYKIDGSNSKNTGGLSIYFPLRDKAHLEEDMKLYRNIGFSESYVAFLDAFQNHMTSLSSDDELTYDLKPPNDQSDFYHVLFEDEDLDKIAQVYLDIFVLTEDDPFPDYTYIGYGYDNLVFFDTSDRYYNEMFDKDWVHLDNTPLLIRLMSDNENDIEYESPVIYNQQKMYLLFSYDKIEKKYLINGLRKGVDPITRKPDKEIYQLKPGSTLQPLYRGYNSKYRRFEWVEGEALTIIVDTVITRKDLNAENYVLAFRYYDYSFQSYLTDFFKFER